MKEVHIIAGYRQPVLADYVNHLSVNDHVTVSVLTTQDVRRYIDRPFEIVASETFDTNQYTAAHTHARITRIVVFLNRKTTAGEKTFLDQIAQLIRHQPITNIVVISSFSIHVGDHRAAAAETAFLDRIQDVRCKIAVIRPNYILSANARVCFLLRKLRFVLPLLPGFLTSCFLDGDELWQTIASELHSVTGKQKRPFALLGPNKPWRDLGIEAHQRWPSWITVPLTLILSPLLLLSWIVCWLAVAVARRLSWPCPWYVTTLQPQSSNELLVIYNKYNYRHVKIVGYNNGIIHFGHRYPDKTIVSTVGCNKRARVNGLRAQFDGGVTIRQAMNVLAQYNKELHVLPNYSYVCLSTSFFIPIHGSASQFSTLGETIAKVLLYDPVGDRWIAASRHAPEFRDHMYNLQADVLLLRLQFDVKPKTCYYVEHQKLQKPPSQTVLGYFRDPKPTNVEMRKSGSTDPAVTVSQYYSEPGTNGRALQELPRDALGSLWDRLEANRFTSLLFHTLVRRFGHHVEAFFSEEEFAVFWESHQAVSLSKIQVRFIRRDGYPHSPFRDHDCISVDMFMLKKHRKSFEEYVKTHFRMAAMNPGKHSM